MRRRDGPSVPILYFGVLAVQRQQERPRMYFARFFLGQKSEATSLVSEVYGQALHCAYLTGGRASEINKKHR